MDWFVEYDKAKISFGLSYKEKLHQETSLFQDVLVVDTVAYGKLLVLDNCIMMTDQDEFVYHEMISHIPMCLHKDPKTVVIIGGGDGGTVREMVKYPSIEKIVLCEIDEAVIRVSKEFFPQIAGQLDHPKVEVKVADGIEYIRSLENFADIIVIDSTDPIGPGIGLFTEDFYVAVRKALKPNGIMVAQTESPWDDGAILKKIHSNISFAFDHVKPYTGPIPTYPRGLWSWTMAYNGEILDSYDQKRFEIVREDLKYLHPNLFAHVFSLPKFYRDKLGVPYK